MRKNESGGAKAPASRSVLPQPQLTVPQMEPAPGAKTVTMVTNTITLTMDPSSLNGRSLPPPPPELSSRTLSRSPSF